jgi:hypothetical protein
MQQHICRGALRAPCGIFSNLQVSDCIIFIYKQDLRKQKLSLQPKRSVGKQSQNFGRLRRFARNDVIPVPRLKASGGGFFVNTYSQNQQFFVKTRFPCVSPTITLVTRLHRDCGTEVDKTYAAEVRKRSQRCEEKFVGTVSVHKTSGRVSLRRRLAVVFSSISIHQRKSWLIPITPVRR